MPCVLGITLLTFLMGLKWNGEPIYGRIDDGLRRSCGKMKISGPGSEAVTFVSIAQKVWPFCRTVLFFFFPAIIWYFLKPHLLYHVSPKPLLILFINPWPNLDTIQKVCFPSEGINLDFSPDLMLLEHYNELFFSPRKETANTVAWTLWSWDHWSGGYLHAWTPRHFTMGRTAGSS